MDSLALALAAALLILGVAAVAVRRWRIAAGAVIVGLCLPVLVSARDLLAPAEVTVLASMVSTLPAVVAAITLLPKRPTVRVAVVAGVAAGPVAALLYDRFRDPACLIGCERNPLALAHFGHPAHVALQAAAYVSAAALAIAAVRGPGRLPVLLLAAAASLVALEPTDALAAASVSSTVLLVTCGATIIKIFETRARVSDLTRALESATDVESTLRATVGDPDLSLSYLVDNAEVDRLGRPAPSAAGGGRVSTDIVGPAGVLARVQYNPDRADVAALAAAVRGPARLAFENGRLEATMLRQARALQASRRRIVAHADAERRGMERDLHDGAQQHLLALGLALRAGLDATTDPTAQDSLLRSLAATHLALRELRDLAHGFYPASLAHAGLADALDSLADRSPVPLSVTVPPERLPDSIERAIYLLVARTVETGQHPLHVDISHRNGEVGVVATGTGPLDGVLGDVFAVLDGTLGFAPSPAGGVTSGRLPLSTGSES